MFQCDSHYRCCACTAAVLKCYGLVVPPPPPQGGEPSFREPPPWGEPSRHLGGDYKRGGGGANTMEPQCSLPTSSFVSCLVPEM